MGCCANDCSKGFIEAAGSEKSSLFANSPAMKAFSIRVANRKYTSKIVPSAWGMNRKCAIDGRSASPRNAPSDDNCRVLEAQLLQVDRA